MKIAFLINKDRCCYALGDYDAALFEVKAREQHISVLYKSRGYLYVNQIYELLGLGWDPKNENHCFIFERDGDIKFGHARAKDGGVIIAIKC